MAFPKNSHLKSPAIKPSLKPEIIKLMKEHGPMTTRQISNRIGCTNEGAGYAMRHAKNDFHVSGWNEMGQQIWALGKGENAPRPPKKPATVSKINGAAKERHKDALWLKAPFIKGERIQWGGLCL